MEINGRRIGRDEPTYVVAEVSANHDQEFDRAEELVRAAAESGADAVKLQTYRPDTMTIDSDKHHFRITGGTPWDGKTLYELYGEAYTPWDWQPELKGVAEDHGMDLFSTAFDASAVDFLEEMEVRAHKVASFEVVDIPLVRKMARTGKPLIISTGMATISEVSDAVEAARDEGAEDIGLLKCTSSYPAAASEMNLRTIPHMADAFDVPVGVSDHTTGVGVPVAAVAEGACMVEKHITLSRSDETPDSAFSLEPHEFSDMVDAVRVARKSLGRVEYGVSEGESQSTIFRRSLFIVEDVEEGDELTEDNVRSIRPGNGLPPKHLDDVLGTHVNREVEKGTPLSWDLIG